jgi:molybdopterin-containing oxidoreductase family membrane subunit
MWFKKIRTSVTASFIISIVVNIGMWFERFVIIVTSTHRDYLPSSWTMFSPTFVDIGIFIGTLGFFFVLFLLYARTFPVIAQAEVKTILKSSGERFKALREAGKALYEMPPRGKVVTYEPDPVEQEEVETAEGEGYNLGGAPEAQLLMNRLGLFDASKGRGDNLQKINGIGPIMEKALNQIGIYTFNQLSKLGSEEYSLLDRITGSFPGRAERDDWAGQAKRLLN